MRPDVSATTERLYGSLPAFYRDADEPLDWPLLRYLSLLGDQLGDLEELVDRIDFVRAEDVGSAGDTSDLVDPATADAAWLPWLAQLVGIAARRAPFSLTDSYRTLSLTFDTYADLSAAAATYGELREVTTHISSGDVSSDELRVQIANVIEERRGSQGYIRARLEPLLTDTKTVEFERFVGGSSWQVNVLTLEDETPEPWRIATLLLQPDIAPAGVVLTHDFIP